MSYSYDAYGWRVRDTGPRNVLDSLVIEAATLAYFEPLRSIRLHRDDPILRPGYLVLKLSETDRELLKRLTSADAINVRPDFAAKYCFKPTRTLAEQVELHRTEVKRLMRTKV